MAVTIVLPNSGNVGATDFSINGTSDAGEQTIRGWLIGPGDPPPVITGTTVLEPQNGPAGDWVIYFDNVAAGSYAAFVLANNNQSAARNNLIV